MAYIKGPNSFNHRGGGIAGVGADGYMIRGNWVAVSGVAGEVVPVALGDCQAFKYVAMADTGATIKYTLEHPAYACDPSIQDKVLWTAEQTLAAGEIVECDAPLFTAAQITFTEDGTVYLHSR